MVFDVVAYPIDEIPDLAPEDLRVQNFPNFELGKAGHLDGGGNPLKATRECVCHMRFQKADVEDRMDVHTGGKI